MDRERGDEIPYIAEYRRQSPGLKSRFTAEEIAYIRDVHARWISVRNERIRITKLLNLSKSAFSRIGKGTLGKNPRRA
jgi:hypothetical protein